MTTRAELIERLERLPARLAHAEQELLHQRTDLAVQKERLSHTEAHLMIAGLPGKNTEERAAHLLVLTTAHRQAVAVAQELAAQADLKVRCLQTEFSAARAVARLLEAQN